MSTVLIEGHLKEFTLEVCAVSVPMPVLARGDLIAGQGISTAESKYKSESYTGYMSGCGD
jgi:hypothetical protein